MISCPISGLYKTEFFEYHVLNPAYAQKVSMKPKTKFNYLPYHRHFNHFRINAEKYFGVTWIKTGISITYAQEFILPGSVSGAFRYLKIKSIDNLKLEATFSISNVSV